MMLPTRGSCACCGWPISVTCWSTGHGARQEKVARKWSEQLRSKRKIVPMSTAFRTSPTGPVTLAVATLRRFKDGEATAFADVVRAFTPLMRGVTARYWKGTFEREEAMQEIWLHV